MKKFAVLFLMMTVLLVLNGNILAQGIGSAFTYQGRLNDGGSAAMGQYDLEFKLFDDPNIATGMQTGSTVTHEDINMYDGYFTVALEFSSDPNLFNGDARWLEIAVRSGGLTDPNLYSTLTPRQPLTSVPYAQYALKSGSGSGADADADPTNELQNLGLIGNTLSISRGNSVLLPTGGDADSDPTNEFQTLGLIGNTLSISNGNSVLIPTGGTDADWIINGSNMYSAVAGNVGIGTSTPAFDLDISGSDGFRVTETYGADSHFIFTESGETTWDYGGIEFARIDAEGGPAGILQLSTAVTARVLLRSSGYSYFNGGNVGIGTTSPTRLLDVNGMIGADGLWSPGTMDINSVGSINLKLNTDDVPGNKALGILNGAGELLFQIDETADVYIANNTAIGTIPTNDYQLKVAADTSTQYAGYFRNRTDSDNAYGVYGLADGIGGTTHYGVYGSASGATTNWAGYFSGNLFASGKVAIGTTTPSTDAKLHIESQDKYAGYFTSNKESGYTQVIRAEFTRTGNLDAKAVYGQSVPADNYGYGGYFVGGYTGVYGSVAPTGDKSYRGVEGYVSGGTGKNYGVRGEAEGSGTNYGIYGHASGAGTNYAGYFVGDVRIISGRLNIGTTDPGNWEFYINGDAYKTHGGSSWNVVSDNRLKNIQGPFEYGLDEICSLNPVRFNYKENNIFSLPSDQPHVGIVAQEVQKVIPDAISKTDDGFLTLNMDPVYMAMINAIKQQQKQIINLQSEKQIDQQQHDKEIQLLKQEINELKKNMTILMNSLEGEGK